jgi:hypothetical protein
LTCRTSYNICDKQNSERWVLVISDLLPHFQNDICDTAIHGVLVIAGLSIRGIGRQGIDWPGFSERGARALKGPRFYEGMVGRPSTIQTGVGSVEVLSPYSGVYT